MMLFTIGYLLLLCGLLLLAKRNRTVIAPAMWIFLLVPFAGLGFHRYCRRQMARRDEARRTRLNFPTTKDLNF